ncbi:MAG: ABC transporter permease subunit [Spirochaetaceae bacterium]|jgi:ABC-2 type transport system permease protein|nr:ABC transporter permease subunit [Spirochaetaceae bacterium]
MNAATILNLKQQAATTLALIRKELYSYSISPAFFGIALFFLIFTATWLFQFQNFLQRGEASLRAYFSAFPIAFILVIPAITMRSWAEERKTGNSELLLTLPFSEWSLVLGKFFAALAVVGLLFLLTLPVPFSLSLLGRFDAGMIVAEYAGALLLAGAVISLGLLLSALSKNQVAAFLGSAVVLVFIMLISQIPWTTTFPYWLDIVIRTVALAAHFETFSKGLLDTRDAAYFLVTTVLFLFLNVKVLVFRKWS